MRKAASPVGKERDIRVIARNRQARHEYDIEETYEAGIVLAGTEVRSLRERAPSLAESFCLIRGGEAWIIGLHIPPFSHGNIANRDPDRRRKLLLHRRQIDHLDARLRDKGMALIALQLYVDEANRVKLTIALARGKKLYDKRQDLARRDAERNIQRALKERNNR